MNMTPADYSNMTLIITDIRTGKPVASDSVRTGPRTYTWRSNAIKSDASEPIADNSSKSTSNGPKTYTAKYRNSSTGIIFTTIIRAANSEQARAQAKAWQKGQGNWCKLVGVRGNR